jgi:hypothetical protein
VNFSDNQPSVPAISPEFSQQGAIPTINSRYESAAPLIPPRSQQRSGLGLRPSQDGIPQVQSTLLSPPEGRGLGYQNNGSSDSLSKGNRSTAVITPRTATHPTISGVSSVKSPATSKAPMTSLLVGSAGNIIDQFKGSDYADVGPSNDVGWQVDKTGTWLKVNNSVQAVYFELCSTLKLIRPAMFRQGRTHIVGQLDEIIKGLDFFAAKLRSLIKSEDPTYELALSASQQREVETAMYKLHSLGLWSAELFKKLLADSRAVGEVMVRSMWFRYWHINLELYHVSGNLCKLYPRMQQKILDDSRALASISNREQPKVSSRVRITDTSRPSTEYRSTKTRTASTASKPSTTSAGYMLSPPSSPPNLVSLSNTPANDGHYLTSPTMVPDIFKTGDWLNAGPTGKMELDFINIVKALSKMLDICVTIGNRGTCGLHILHEWYRSMEHAMTLRGGYEGIQKSFKKLAEGAQAVYERMDKLAEMIKKYENRSRLRESAEFWTLMREAIIVSWPHSHNDRQLCPDELEGSSYSWDLASDNMTHLLFLYSISSPFTFYNSFANTLLPRSGDISSQR